MKTYFFALKDLWKIVEDIFIAPTNISTITTAKRKKLKENKWKGRS